MIKETLAQVKSFYRKCDKPTFFFTLAIINQVVGFTPGIPSIGIYAIMIAYAIYCYNTAHNINWALVAFLLYVPFGIMASQPDPVFKSWERYVLFVLLWASVSPILKGKQVRNYRRQIFKIVIFACAILGVGSFFCRFIGINYGASAIQTELMTVGTFGGLCNHSMLLGPIAGVGAIYMAKLVYQTKKRKYVLLALLCLFSVMFSASRASLLASIAGIIIMLYKQSGTTSKFFQTIVVVVVVAAMSFSFWGEALDDVIVKNEANVAEGSFLTSRIGKWELRYEEFKNSPFFGVGFAAIDLNNIQALNEVDYSKGTVETGSSWLCILSMTGLLGALCLFPVFFSAFKTVLNRKTELSPIIVGVLTLFYVHMFAEGYVFAGGSFLAFTLWLTVGVSYDQKKEKSV